MNVTFVARTDPSLPRLVARLVVQDALPADLPPALLQGAEASRFAGKTGQVFEGFLEAGARIAVGALAAFPEDDAALDLQFLGRYQRGGEAVGLHRHDHRQAGRFDLLVVGGDVAQGEGVVVAAFARDAVCVITGANGGRATAACTIEGERLGARLNQPEIIKAAQNWR